MATSMTVTVSPVSRWSTLAIEHLGEDKGLARALLEAAQVDGAVDDHLAGVDRGDPADRHEDASPGLHLDDETEHARRLTG